MVDSAELFEAIAHPARIKIIKILERQPASFASLKRQLGIDSSGNLDFHLKKLRQLVIVREDGLYGLSAAGKEALISIEAIEEWTRTKKRKIRIPPKIPKEVLFLGLLEVCATLLAFWFLTISPPISNWGYLPPVVLLLVGLCAALGIFTQQEWSWQVVLVKSGLIFSMSLLLLNYLWQPDEIAQSTAIYYLAFVAVEMIIVVLALRHPLQDFLGVAEVSRISFPTVLAGSLCIFSGILLIVLEMTHTVPRNDNLAVGSIDFAHFISDVTVLAGLTVIIGGVLILLSARSLASYVLGALLSILCGLYPRPTQGSHAYDFFMNSPSLAHALGPFATPVGLVTGSLPILVGVIAMFVIMRIIIIRRIRF